MAHDNKVTDDPFVVEFDLDFPEPDPYLRYHDRTDYFLRALTAVRDEMRARSAAKKAAAQQERPAS